MRILVLNIQTRLFTPEAGSRRKVEWKRLEVGAKVEAEPVWVEQSHHRSLDRSPEAE
jgi:hypothetical protein